MAHNDFSSLFRGRSYFWRFCDGVDDHDSRQVHLWAGGHDHDEAHRQHGEDHSADRDDRGLRLPDGALRSLLLRGHLRNGCLYLPNHRSLLVGVCSNDELQRIVSSTFLVPVVPGKPLGRDGSMYGGKRRDVVRALRHHRDNAGP